VQRRLAAWNPRLTQSNPESTLSNISRRRLAIATAGALGLTALLPSTSALGASAPTGPVVTLRAATSSVALSHYPDEPIYFFDLGVYALTGGSDLEVRTTRPNYHTPVRSDLILTTKGSKSTTRLPKGLVTDFYGLTAFSTLTVKDSAGKTVWTAKQNWCPGAYGSRMKPNAAPLSPYPDYCAGSPWALGGVLGMPANWASLAAGYDFFGTDQPPILPDGTYTATTTISDGWRKVFKTPASKASATVTLAISTYTDNGGGGGVGLANRSQAAARAAAAGQFPKGVPANLLGRVDGLLPRAAQPGSAAPAGAAPAAAGQVPSQPASTAVSAAGDALSRTDAARTAKANRPDLRSLPAFGIGVIGDFDDPLSTREYLGFAATTWNAGPSPLVVDGYRRAGTDIMDGYQFFYDSKGREVGHTSTGTLAYDPRVGHTHWHFKDFAKYELLSGDGATNIRSGKESWCLAPTDAVDLTVKGAQYKPYSTGLGTACGGQQAIALRETMDTGWGDTYGQFLPGQSFDITDLPNGEYVIRVTANPDGNLLEGDMSNNVSNRTVIIGGTPGARTVTVPPYDGLDIP
jgi:hypothetical protein